MPAYRDKRSGQWRYRKRITLPDGRRTRIEGTPPTNTKAAAESAERAHIFRLQHPTTASKDTPKEVPTLDDYSKVFLAHYASGKPSDLDAKEQILGAYLKPRWGGWPLDAIGQPEVDALVAELLAKPVARKTANNILGVLSSLLRMAARAELISMPDLRLAIKLEEAELVATPEEDIDALLAVVDARYQVAILLAADAGLRIGEVRGLRWADIDELRRRLEVVRALDTKGRLGAPKHWRKRRVPISDRLWAALEAVPRRGEHVVTRISDGKPLSYWAARDALGDAYSAAGIASPKHPWHSLRHACGTRLAAAGVPIAVIQQLLGHRSILTTMRYVHTDEAQLDDAVSKAFGRQVGDKPSAGKKKPRNSRELQGF